MSTAPITSLQFEALSTLLRARGGPITFAARRVLVDGTRQAEACRELAVRRDALSNAVKRYRSALELAQDAAGVRRSPR